MTSFLRRACTIALFAALVAFGLTSCADTFTGSVEKATSAPAEQAGPVDARTSQLPHTAAGVDDAVLTSEETPTGRSTDNRAGEHETTEAATPQGEQLQPVEGSEAKAEEGNTRTARGRRLISRF